MFASTPLCLKRFILPFLFLAAVHSMWAQADGFTVQERPGVVMVKSQAWSKPQESTPLEFLAFTDRTASGGGQAGYYEFRTKQVDKRQIPATKVAKLIVYPDPKNFPDIANAEDRQKVVALIESVKASVAEFPSTKTYVDPSLKALDAELKQYDSGELKLKGEWVSKDVFYAERIKTLGNQLRLDISQASSPQAFDLSSDPRFVSLQDLAPDSPNAAKLVAELSDLHAKRVRDEQRKALLAQLASPSIGLSEAEGAVARLQGLQPSEDPAAAGFLKKWDSGMAVVKSTTETARPLATAIEEVMAPIQQPDSPPSVTDDIKARIIALNASVAPFLASRPAPVLVTAARVPVSICKLGDGLAKLGPLFGQKQFFQAQDVLDSLIVSGRDVGPQTTRVMTELQKKVAARTEQFSKLREEARLLIKAGKPAEALPKFEAAYAILADKNVGEEIESLKKTLPAP